MSRKFVFMEETRKPEKVFINIPKKFSVAVNFEPKFIKSN